MDLRNEDLPVTLQAFDLVDSKEIFIAEQVVNSQTEADTFTSRFVGKVIKAKKAMVADNRDYKAVPERKKNNVGLIMIIIILILVALIIYGFATGWIQQTFNLNV